MLEAPSDLPDDVAVLQAMIALQNEKLSIFETEIKERDYRIEKLEHQLAGLRRHRFGARSEALDQLELTLEDEEIAQAVETPVGEDITDATTDTPKGKPKRKPLPRRLSLFCKPKIKRFFHNFQPYQRKSFRLMLCVSSGIFTAYATLFEFL